MGKYPRQRVAMETILFRHFPIQPSSFCLLLRRSDPGLIAKELASCTLRRVSLFRWQEVGADHRLTEGVPTTEPVRRHRRAQTDCVSTLRWRRRHREPWRLVPYRPARSDDESLVMRQVFDRDGSGRDDEGDFRFSPNPGAGRACYHLANGSVRHRSPSILNLNHPTGEDRSDARSAIGGTTRVAKPVRHQGVQRR